MFKIAEVTLSAAVATNGTFTVSYPAGTTAGSYTGGHEHVMFALGAKRVAPDDFTVSFGASNITVTHKGSTTLPVGTRIRIQFEMFGADSSDVEKVTLPAAMRKAPLTYVDLGAPATADADGVAASQTVTGAGTAFVLNGALVSNGVAVFDVPRNVVAAWTNTAVLTITGTDADGNTVVEQSASGTSHTGVKAFKTVTSVKTSATVTSATVGSGNVLGLPRFVPDASWVVGELMDGALLPRKPGQVYLPWEIEATELAAGTAENLVSPVAGYINGMRAIVQEAVTTGGAITVEINTTAITGLSVTVADGATAGTRYSDAPTTRHGSDSLVAAGDRITVTPAAAFATAGAVNGLLAINVTPAGQLDGTFVAGATSAATATTGDTRGTYTPSVTPDGAKAFALLVSMPDPADQGVAQYKG